MRLNRQSKRHAPDHSSDFDGAWKEALCLNFKVFISTYFPDIARLIGRNHRNGSTRKSVRSSDASTRRTAPWTCWCRSVCSAATHKGF